MKKLVLLTLLITLSSICFAPRNPYREILLHESYVQCIQDEETEKRISLILKTIRVVESGGSYTVGGGSGEVGAYQFMPATWKYYCKLYFNEILDISNPFNQDRVAKLKVKGLVEKGYSNAEIASVWNCGSRYWAGKIGINWKGISYNVPLHVNRFLRIYKKLENKKYISIMRNYKVVLVAYNRGLNILNSLEGLWTKESIRKVNTGFKESSPANIQLSRIAVNACEAGLLLREALLRLSPQIQPTRCQRIVKYIKNKKLCQRSCITWISTLRFK